MDVKRIIAEVAAQNGIRVEADDPVFALVTINKLVLEEALQRVADLVQKRTAEYLSAFDRCESMAGRTLAEDVRKAAEQIRRGMESDISAAGTRAREIVEQVNAANRRPLMIQWFVMGLSTAAGFFGLGALYERLLH
jgi:hypothetical protein